MSVPRGTRLFIGVSADKPMEVQFHEADGPGEGFYSGSDYDALTDAYREAVKALAELVRLKDGARDDTYRAAKDAAWDRARTLLDRDRGR